MQICTRAVTHDQGALELRADDPDVETHPDGRTVGVLPSVRGGSAPPTRLLRRQGLVPVTPLTKQKLSKPV